MIKMMILAPRRDGMTHAEFRRYVTDVHGPLVKSVAEVAADIRHYHYNFPILGAVDSVFGHPIAGHLDIVTEAWFDSVEAQKKNMEHPRYLQILRPDEHRFANAAGAVMHYTREISVIEGERSRFKVFYFRRRRRDLSREEFQRLWLAAYPTALSGNSDLSHAIRGYVQNHVVSELEHPDGTNEQFYDVIDEFFVSDLQRFATMRDDQQSLEDVRALEHDLLARSGTMAFVAETVVNIQ